MAAGIGAGYVYFPTISFLDSRSVWVGKRTFVFVFRRSLWKDASKVKLRAYFGKDTSKSLVYWYDFGDDWMHIVKLELVSDEVLLHPRCLAGKGTCPPEDCGGVGGYEYLKALFREDPESEEAQDMREWLGLEEDETWDANYFNLEEAT